MSALTASVALSRLLGQLVLFGADAPADFVPYASDNEWSYVVVGWGLVIAGIALYALLTLRRGRQLSRQLPPGERRWTS